MAAERHAAWKAIRRFMVILSFCILILALVLWRSENKRIERFRYALSDQIIPNTTFILKPFTVILQMTLDFQSYTRLYQQNLNLKRELQKMKSWKETAFQLEEKNTQLSILNNVKLNPRMNWITGEVIADSGSPFNQSALLNIGSRDGVKDGSAAMDGLGVVGRISGVGHSTSRVLFLTDVSSSLPIILQETGQRALATGDNSLLPTLNFLETSKSVQAGMRVITSGEGSVLPPNLLLGTVAIDSKGQLRVILAAEFSELNYLRIISNPENEALSEPGKLVIQ
jgi:rod shape-determining protein MreC